MCTWQIPFFAALPLLFCVAPSPAQDPEVVTSGADQQYTGVYEAVPLKVLAGQRWRFETAGDASGTVVVCDGAAFFGCSEGYLYAIDTETGKERWRFSAGKKLYNA